MPRTLVPEQCQHIERDFRLASDNLTTPCVRLMDIPSRLVVAGEAISCAIILCPTAAARMLLF